MTLLFAFLSACMICDYVAPMYVAEEAIVNVDANKKFIADSIDSYVKKELDATILFNNGDTYVFELNNVCVNCCASRLRVKIVIEDHQYLYKIDEYARVTCDVFNQCASELRAKKDELEYDISSIFVSSDGDK